MAKASETDGPVTRLEKGRCYFLNSPRFDYVGRVISIDGPYTVTLEDAALVMYSGRWHEFIRDGRAAGMEVEPMGVVGVQWVAWAPWPHDLLREPT